MSDTSRLLDDTADRLLSRLLADPFARTKPDLEATVTREFIEGGLNLVLASEEAGGLGAGLEEAGTIAWRAGFHAAPAPVVPLMLLPTLPGGDGEGVTLASPGSVRLEGGKLAGGRIDAPCPEGTTSILVACDGDKGPVCLRVDAANARRFHGLDHSSWMSLDAKDATIVSEAAAIDFDRLKRQGALLTAAAMVGAMAQQLDIIIDYANTRKQFGKPLGKFQALQHHIATSASEHTVAQAAVAGAISAYDGGWGRPLLWQSAKAYSGRAATIVTTLSHQVLGAIGFTEEHALHNYSKRLWMWRDDWGRQSLLEQAVGEAACADPAGLWSYLVDDAA